MSRWRLASLSLLIAASIALAGLAVSSALRDTTAPRLYLEPPERAASGSEVTIFVSADEPVSYRLNYATELHEAVAQDHRFTVVAVAGRLPATISASDAAGNVTTISAVVIGVPPPAPALLAAGQVRAGDPLGITLLWGETAAAASPRAQGADAPGAAATEAPDPATAPGTADSSAPAGQQPLDTFVAEAAVVAHRITLAGEELLTAPRGGGVDAIVATPFAVDPTEMLLEASVTDEFGRVVSRALTVTLEPLPVIIEQLNLNAQTLAVITPAGRELEARTWAEARAQTMVQRLWSEPFMLPINGVGTSGFADARRYAPGGPVSFHNGLDLAAPTGTPILATNAGRVLIAGNYPIKGGWVMLDHGGGVMSHYFHLSRVLVEVGQLVGRGDLLGEVGSTGLSTGPHLHWEMRVGDLPSSPLAWVDRSFP